MRRTFKLLSSKNLRTFRLSAILRFGMQAVGKLFQRLRDFFAEARGHRNGFDEI